VLGTVEIARDLTDIGVVIAVGSPRNYGVTRAIVERLDLDPDRYVTLIHPTASIGSEVTIGEGSVLLAGCVVTHAATIGKHVAMMPHVVVTHDDEVGDYAILGAGAKLGGGVKVGEGAYIGSSASVPTNETWAGVPARPLY
jgi:acetyltransferase-like isoleucine patch superfamily enzyme